jgi:hypothetical protein
VVDIVVAQPTMAITWRNLQQFGSDQLDLNINIAARGLGVRASLVGFIDQGLGDLAINAGLPDIEPGAQEEAFVRGVQVDFGLDADARRQ